MTRSIQLLTIDAAGTLIRPWPSVGLIYANTAKKFGIPAEEKLTEKYFLNALKKAQKEDSQTKVNEKDFWRKVVNETLRPFGETTDLDPVFEELWNLFAKGDCWRLSDGVKETLHELKKRGYQLAVLSNNDSRLRPVLADLEVNHYFQEIFISSEIGYEKPHPRIFKFVEEKMELPPEHIIHLGDSYTRDFEGARNAEWSAILFGEYNSPTRSINCFPELLDILL